MAWQDSISRTSCVLFAADESEDTADLPPADQVVEGCPLQSHIVDVGFTAQAGENALFDGTRVQYVNLSRPQIRDADPDIVSDNQLGRQPAIFVRVSPAAATNVRVKLVRNLNRGGFPAGSSTLSAREQGLSHLSWSRTEHTYTTDENGELLIEPGLSISALGGGVYHVKAALVGQSFVTSTNAVQVKKRIYLRPIKHYQTGWQAALTAMRAIKRQLDSLGVEVKLVRSRSGRELGVCEETSLASPLENMGVDALRSSTEHIRELRPHSVAVIVGQFIADPIAAVAFRVDVTRNASGQFPATVAVSLTNSGSTYVLVPLNDASQFVSGTLNSLGHSANIVAADISGLGNFAQQVTVNISRVSGGFAVGINTVRLTIRLKAINAWAVGWAYNSFPVIYLNMRDPNTGNVLSGTQAEALMVHELGHKLHLTASGAAQQPDQQAHYYPSFNTNGVSHMGPHCSQGVAAGTNLWTSAAHTAATCTMWGALKQTTQFCDECKTSLRKVHLGSGF